MAGRPGMMLYFELLPCLQELTDEQVGRLVRGMLTYGQTGKEPQWQDAKLQTVWPFLRLRLDQDEERYRRRVEKNRRAALSRWQQAENRMEESL